ncbi:MAG: imidazolonepropionase [Myxococcota bacterium]|jgi:imidazolonepropionase|nr:imidazolonepropionase [Myxococcota bacterium]
MRTPVETVLDSSYVLIAEQMLCMDGWRDKERFSPHLDALRRRDEQLLGLRRAAALRVQDGVITWMGPAAELEADALPRFEVPLLMPAWCECHTHALFGGERAQDFAARNTGVSYAELLEQGGGISSTVRATRASSDEALLASLRERLLDFGGRGVTWVEVKTGYGLSVDEELRHLRLIKKAAQGLPLRVRATFLGAHALPPEYRQRADDYVKLIIEEALPAVRSQGIASCCDVFCDRGAFTLAQTERILRAAKELGFDIRVHAEELSLTGATQLGVELGALSADHLDHLDQAGVDCLSTSRTVGVLLPGVTVYLDMHTRPPARDLVEAGASIALSTDFNPGSCNTQDLALMTTLGCSLLKLTPGEALWAVTAGAAQAMGVGDEAGQLAVGRRADLLAFKVSDYVLLPYAMGQDLLLQRFHANARSPLELAS